jgi:hypothetical protein
MSSKSDGWVDCTVMAQPGVMSITTETRVETVEKVAKLLTQARRSDFGSVAKLGAGADRHHRPAARQQQSRFP